MNKKLCFVIMAVLLVTCASASRRMIIPEGQSVLFEVDGTSRILQVKIISEEARKVVFALDGEQSLALAEKEYYRFSEGSEIFVGHLYLNGNAPDLADIYFTLSHEAKTEPLRKSPEEIKEKEDTKIEIRRGIVDKEIRAHAKVWIHQQYNFFVEI